MSKSKPKLELAKEQLILLFICTNLFHYVIENGLNLRYAIMRCSYKLHFSLKFAFVSSEYDDNIFSSFSKSCSSSSIMLVNLTWNEFIYKVNPFSSSSHESKFWYCRENYRDIIVHFPGKCITVIIFICQTVEDHFLADVSRMWFVAVFPRTCVFDYK